MNAMRQDRLLLGPGMRCVMLRKGVDMNYVVSGVCACVKDRNDRA